MTSSMNIEHKFGESTYNFATKYDLYKATIIWEASTDEWSDMSKDLFERKMQEFNVDFEVF